MKKGSIYVNERGAGKSHADCAGSHCEEDAVYMRDYVLNDNGDIKELCFDDVEMQEQDR